MGARRPAQLRACRSQFMLKVSEKGRFALHGMWRRGPCEAVGGEVTGSLADVPLHRMESIASIGDVSSTDVLVRSHEVAHPARNKRAEWNLKRSGRHVNIAVPSGGGVQVNAIHPHSDRVRIPGGASVTTNRVGDVVLGDGGYCSDAAGLSVIDRLGQSVCRTHHVRSQPQTGKSGTSVFARSLGLHPVQHREAELSGVRDASLRLIPLDIEYWLKKVI